MQGYDEHLALEAEQRQELRHTTSTTRRFIV
ncbi:MAG: hypothetical protein ACI8PT_004672 [Gammaproteobacteria bacterium]|jgi:hypothetical protein